MLNSNRRGHLIELSKAELELGLRDIGEQEDRLRRRLNELEDIVQNAPGSHRPGYPSAQTLQAEHDITTVVLALCDLDRKRQELTVEMSLNKFG